MGAAFAWGGGPRQQPTKAGAGQLFAMLFLHGVLQLACLAEGMHVVIAAAPITSAIGYGILLSSRPRRDGLDGASRLFTAQRIGDAGLVLALGVIWVAHQAFDPQAVAALLETTKAADAFAQGPFVGAPRQTAWTLAGVLMLGGCGLRLACFPWVSIGRHATGAPAPVSALVVGTTGLGVPLLILLKCAPVVLLTAPNLLQMGVVVALVSACFHAAIGAATKRVLAIDLHVLTTLALVGAALAVAGGVVAAAIALSIVTVGAVLLALSSSAVIEAMQGQTDVMKLGGLGASLPWTRRGRLLTLGVVSAAPGGVGFLFFVLAARHAQLGTLAQTVVVLLAAIVTFTGFRAHHLQFGGPSVRGERPARLVEQNPVRLALPLLIGVAAVALGYALLPPNFEKTPVPTAIAQFMAPALGPTRTALALQPTSPVGWLTAPTTAFVCVLAATGFASVVGWLLFGQGPGALLKRVEDNPGLKSLGRLLGAGAFFERLIDRIVAGPVMKGARFVVQTVLPTLIVAPPTRLPALPATAFGFVLRIIHNGDMQRGLLFLVVSVSALLWWWSLR